MRQPISALRMEDTRHRGALESLIWRVLTTNRVPLYALKRPLNSEKPTGDEEWRVEKGTRIGGVSTEDHETRQ